ncbi:MAG: protein translocase subunit SecD [Gammaproteobacteria bacterium]|nr:protein translocase subunit SecD [Gammaproteobacteria bacterium]NNF61643.1 protein translocase subunit SecD [Gammaproteobacteria bacterium]NNM20551.1 protein translocase subunit SecD [Gammaproteobacteria bacterium]
MQNRYPMWVNLVVAGVVIFGLIFAMPNIYGEDPAVQVALEDGEALGESLIGRVDGVLQGEGLETTGAYLEDGRVVVRFADEESQFRAKPVLEETLGEDYVVAMTLAPRMPDWMRSLGLGPMSLGLDLRGGVHFLFEVDMEAAISQVMQNYERDMKTLLREQDIRYRSVRATDAKVFVVLRDEADRDSARRAITEETQEVQMLDTTVNGSPALELALTEVTQRQRQDFAIEQNITTLRNRVNELGVAEPVVQRQGIDRVVVQLPGVQDATKARDILGATATLSFHLADESNNPIEAERTGRAPTGSRLYQHRNGQPVLLKRDVIVTGDQITDAQAGFSEGQPAVFVDLDPKGARRMLDTTKNNIDRGMGVVFIEQKRRTVERGGERVEENYTDEQVISLATIRGVFSNSFQITGLTPIEARDLSLLLRAGSLAAPIYIVEERTIGPSLGQENIDQGRMAVIIGFLLVVVFMLVYYKLFGLFANLALLVNLVMIVALLSLLQASLTLPGIAGIVLTVGMAVDANVLIFERIREELRNGNTPQAAIHSGYEKAFSSIADANITTLIAALVLWTLGSGPIRGFAVTLSLGIATSMFTAIVGTRALVNLIYGGKRVDKLAI